MSLQRLRAGEWLAATAAVALVVSLMLPWYDDRSGFESFTVVDVLLLLVAAVAIALPVLQATRTSPALPVAFGVLTVVTGVIGVLITLFRLIDAPRRRARARRRRLARPRRGRGDHRRRLALARQRARPRPPAGA